jgi:hypothetical protein
MLIPAGRLYFFSVSPGSSGVKCSFLADRSGCTLTPPFFSVRPKPPAFPRDSPVFLCPKHQDANARIASRDIRITIHLLIFGSIDAQSRESETLTGGAHLSGVLSDSRREHQCIHSAKHRHHFPYALS